MVRSIAAHQVGGGLGAAPLAAVAEPSPAERPASGTPFRSVLGRVFRSADRTNAPPPCGLFYGGARCSLLHPRSSRRSRQALPEVTTPG